MDINFDPSGILNGLAETEIRMRAAVGLFGDAAAKKLEADAKKNAPWKDCSGDARKSIQGESEWAGANMKVGVSGNMDYFVFLEYAMEKRYSVLEPTILKLSPEIVEGMRNLLVG